MMGESPDRRADHLSRYRDRIRSLQALAAAAPRPEWHMTKSLILRAGSLSRALLLLIPFYSTTEQRQHLKQSCSQAFAAPHAQKRCRQCTRATTRTHAPIAAHAPRRPSTGKRAGRPADDIVEELELRQRLCEVFSGSVK